MAAKKNKKKVRVAFRKNREKRSRSNKVTREALDEESELLDRAASERLSGKGDLTRRRTVVATEGDQGELQREIDESGCLSGRVLSAIGLNSFVQLEDGRQLECTVRRIVRTMARDARNAVVTGDRVLVRPGGDEHQGVIERVEPRSSILSRHSRRSEHIIVANVDCIVIIASLVDPPLKPSLIDRFLISAAKGDVSAVICFNKADLIELEGLQPILGIYGRLGYQSFVTSAETGLGVEALRQHLHDKAVVFAGQSGVGKSSLINQLDPELDQQVTAVSDWTGKGRHTTRRAMMIPVSGGGWVIDTPGIRQFALWDVMTEEVEGYFSEFRPFVARCRFPDCSHTHEHDCGVKRACELGLISRVRYFSYLKIISDELD